jgi:hypothetical protein
MSDPPRIRPQAYEEPAAPPAAPRLRAPRRLALLIGLPVLLVVVLGGVALAVRAASQGGPQAGPTTAYTYAGNPAAAEMNSAAAERDASRERVRSAVGGVLTAQSTALLAGDKATFTGFADAGAKLVKPWLTERFTSLRALGIAQWTPTVTSVSESGTARWTANVDVDYCFVVPCPRVLRISLHTTWNLGDPTGPKLTEMYVNRPGRTSPPWTRSVLRAVTGNRVVVASTQANAGRLTATLADAEAAAAVADRFGGDVKPGRYVIYLAGDAEWGKWPYGDEGRWVAGYAQQETESAVVRLSALKSIGMGPLLRHELTHVSSLAGQSDEVKDTDSWWLSEGLAEYAINGDQPYATYPRRAETSAFVTTWKGDLRVGEPGAKSSARDASARYGTAYLAVACLFQTYGERKALAFFHGVAVNGTSPANTAGPTLGVPWTEVSNTCAAKIRSTART